MAVVLNEGALEGNRGTFHWPVSASDRLPNLHGSREGELLNLGHFAKFILPPRDPSPEALEAWRLAVFLALVVLFVAIGIHIAWARGYLEEGAGFVTRNEAKTLSADVARRVHHVETRLNTLDQADARLETLLLEMEIRRLRAAQCRAILKNNADAARSTNQLIQERRRVYYRLTGSVYDLPTCPEAGVLTRDD